MDALWANWCEAYNPAADFQSWSPADFMRFVEAALPGPENAPTVNLIQGLGLDGDMIGALVQEPEDALLLPIPQDKYNALRNRAEMVVNRYSEEQENRMNTYRTVIQTPLQEERTELRLAQERAQYGIVDVPENDAQPAVDVLEQDIRNRMAAFPMPERGGRLLPRLPAGLLQRARPPPRRAPQEPVQAGMILAPAPPIQPAPVAQPPQPAQEARPAADDRREAVRQLGEQVHIQRDPQDAIAIDQALRVIERHEELNRLRRPQLRQELQGLELHQRIVQQEMDRLIQVLREQREQVGEEVNRDQQMLQNVANARQQQVLQLEQRAAELRRRGMELARRLDRLEVRGRREPERPVILAPPEQQVQFAAARDRMIAQARDRARAGRRQQNQNAPEAPPVEDQVADLPILAPNRDQEQPAPNPEVRQRVEDEVPIPPAQNPILAEAGLPGDQEQPGQNRAAQPVQGYRRRRNEENERLIREIFDAADEFIIPPRELPEVDEPPRRRRRGDEVQELRERRHPSV